MAGGARKKARAGAGGDARREKARQDPRFSAMFTAPKFRKLARREKATAAAGGAGDEAESGVDERFAFPPPGADSDDDVHWFGQKTQRKKNGKAKKAKKGRKRPRQEEAGAEAEDEEQDEEQDSSGSNEAEAGAHASEDEDESEEEDESGTAGPMRGQSLEDRLAYLDRLSRGEVEDASDSSEDDEDDNHADAANARKRARQAATDDSEEEDEDDEDNEDDDEVEIGDVTTAEHFKIIKGEEIPVGDATRRLAVVHLCWDELRAVDVLAILNSFCPVGGRVRRLTVYLSDYGKDRLAEEDKLGPAAIWRSKTSGKANGTRSGANAEEEAEKEEEEEEEADQDNDSDEDGEEEAGKSGAKSGTGRRKPGLIFEVPTAENENGTGEQSVDDAKLREYELQKHRYYFAIADCDSIKTANALYNMVDQMEIERSSTEFDLRFVPDDVDFAGREVRDTCSQVPGNYVPHEFVARALQQTRVECTWDEPDRERSSKLQHDFSGWRDLGESDFRVYLASSDSDDSDDEDNEEEDDGEDRTGNISKGSQSKRRKRKQKEHLELRKALLGGDADDEDEDDLDALNDNVEEEEDEESEDNGEDDGEDGAQANPADDDFFVHPSSSDEEGEDADDTGPVGQSMSFVPDLGRALLEKKRAKREQARETPFEKKLRIMRERQAEKRRSHRAEMKARAAERKKQKEEARVAAAAAAAAARRASSGNGQGRGREAPDGDDEEGRLRAEMELMFAGDEEEEHARDFDMGALLREEKKRERDGKRGKSKAQRKKAGAAADVPGSDFHVNVADERFKAVFEGDAEDFAIDPMSKQFHGTAGMKQVLAEQSRQRAAVRTARAQRPRGNAVEPQQSSRGQDVPTTAADLDSMIARVKAKAPSAPSSARPGSSRVQRRSTNVPARGPDDQGSGTARLPQQQTEKGKKTNKAKKAKKGKKEKKKKKLQLL